ncbi:hypothetical protein DBR17_08510 [Sphingomonas sp. HMWF008]|nr:hypothetical protein DBR17_08510 [Sphingomonas sp. HMWF008]
MRATLFPFNRSAHIRRCTEEPLCSRGSPYLSKRSRRRARHSTSSLRTKLTAARPWLPNQYLASNVYFPATYLPLANRRSPLPDFSPVPAVAVPLLDAMTCSGVIPHFVHCQLAFAGAAAPHAHIAAKIIALITHLVQRQNCQRSCRLTPCTPVRKNFVGYIGWRFSTGRLPCAAMELQRRFGVNVKLARKSAGISQETLADLAGLARSHMSDLERGIGNATLATVEAVGGALGIAPESLLTRDFDPDQP